MLAVLQAPLAVVLYLGLQGALILPSDFGQEGGDMVTNLWPPLLGAFHRLPHDLCSVQQWEKRNHTALGMGRGHERVVLR